MLVCGCTLSDSQDAVSSYPFKSALQHMLLRHERHMLLRHESASPSCFLRQGDMTALHVAAINGHSPVVKLLLADPRVDVNLTDSHVRRLVVSMCRFTSGS